MLGSKDGWVVMDKGGKISVRAPGVRRASNGKLEVVLRKRQTEAGETLSQVLRIAIMFRWGK